MIYTDNLSERPCEPTPLVVLDVDGVLNRWTATPSPLLCEPECVRNLNRILDETSAKIVVSSTLRGMVHQCEMTLAGLGYLLRSHAIRGEVVGVTEPDVENPDCEGNVFCRGTQIRVYLRNKCFASKYVVLDDEDDGISERGLNFVRVNGSVGLTEGDAERAIEILRK